MADPGSRAFPSRALALLALLGAASMTWYHLGFFLPRMLQLRAESGVSAGYSFGDDFYPIWLSIRQWRAEHTDLYSAQMTREIQSGLFGRPLDPHNPNDPPSDYRQFAYPAFTDLLLWPTASLDFPTLRVVLIILLPALTIASIWLWMLALDWHLNPLEFSLLTVLTLCTYELLEAFFAEQPGLLVNFFLAAGSLALRRNRLVLAGAILSLTLIKPQMSALALLYLLLWSLSDRRRIRFLIGFLAVTGTLLLSSMWIWPGWIMAWTRILFGYHRYAMPPLISVLLGSGTHPSVGLALIGLCLALGVLLAWRNRRADAVSPRFWLTLSLLLAIASVALLPGQAVYDHVILIPAILLLLRYHRELRVSGPVPRALLSIAVAVLVWPWISSFLLIASRPLLGARFYSTPIFTLPIRTAASLPFMALALLAYALRIIPSRHRELA